MTAVRLVVSGLALAVVVVLGPPAVLGWVPLAVDDPASGVPSGSLSVVAPVAAGAPQAAASLSSGDVVTLADGGDGLVTRTVTSVADSTLTLATQDGSTTQVPADRLRAVEKYRLPVLGHVVQALAPARPWAGRLIGIAFLLWGAADIWRAVTGRRRGRHESRVDERALARALQPRALTATPATSEAMRTPQPTRRSRSRSRKTGPWQRFVDAAAGAVGAVVMAARTLDHRHEAIDSDSGAADRADGSGRHRSPGPATTVSPRRRGRGRSPAPEVTLSRPETPSPAAAGASVPPSGELGTSRPDRTGSTRASERGGSDDLWAPRASMDEVAHAARVQEFESRRVAAEASMTLDTDEQPSPVDRLLVEKENARRRDGGPIPSE